MNNANEAAGAAMAASGTVATGSGALHDMEHHGKLGIFRLVASVITLILGAGVFTLSGDQAAHGANGAAILTAWGISAVGVLCLVMTFFALSRLKPQLKGGIYSYAAAGFGDFLGFNSAWGYWISAILCTVSFSALLCGALSYFFPVFGTGNNLASVIVASCIIWFYAFLVSRGVKEAAGVNLIITISKFVPIFVALTAIIFFQKFDVNIFMENMAHGSVEGMSFFEQVSGTMMVTIWVFLGIEGAVAISGRAKKDSDVGKATVIAFVCVLTIYLLVSTLSMGVMPLSELSELSELSNPALAGVMERAVGPWGATLINGGVVLSLVGAMLGYTVLSAECPYEAAAQVSTLSMGVMPLSELSELSELSNPALAGVMERAVGPWGATLINGGVVLSLVGAMLGYTVLSAECPYEAAAQGGFVKAFARVNKKGAPIVTLVVTNLIIEMFLVIMLFSESTYQFFYALSAGMILLPYLLSAAYFAKVAFTEAGSFKGKLGVPVPVWRVFAVLGVIYSVFLAWASGAVGVTLMSILYAPGILVYIKGKKERNQPFLENTLDRVVAAVILIAAIVSIGLLVTGTVSI